MPISPCGRTLQGMSTLHLSPATVPPRPSRRWRLAVALVALPVGIGALFGGYGLLRDAEGLGAKPDWLEGSPFPDYTVPGVVLLVVIGGGLCATAAAALLRSPRAPTAAGVMGIVLLVWGVVETVTIGYRGAPQIVMLALFVAAPALTLVALARAQRRRAARGAA